MVIRTHNGNCYTEICLAFLDDAFVISCTFILFNKNEIIYHQETSMLRSLSIDTITHTTNQPDKETTSDTTLLDPMPLCPLSQLIRLTFLICEVSYYHILSGTRCQPSLIEPPEGEGTTYFGFKCI